MFRNPALFAEVSRNGFAIIDANITEEARRIHSYICGNFNISLPYFNYSLLENTFEQNLAIQTYFKKTFKDFYEAHFTGYKTINHSFLVKPAHTGEEFFLHQDWCYTDETKFTAYNVWIPLADVARTNGAMFFLPGSHLWFENFRSGSLPTARISHAGFTGRQVKTVELKMGQVLLFHPAVFHGSFPNLSSEHRIVATSTIMQADTPFLYFQKSSDVPDEVTVYPLDDDTFLRDLKTLATGGKPDSPEIKRIKYLHSIITEAELAAKYARNS